ncbi:5263_t:CDS:2 [Ambispora gerdemannii]|uniref:5263_t:CDS:1 n=1 Tax=Ambispora gerdemannii TaxID=144530 RepID=A0A9N8YU49_9GLOM|nr:5263_t:CDS:2 [Ambispora gerdemannii]
MPTSGFNPNRLKVHLKLSVNRLKLTQQKKNAVGKEARKEIAELLKIGKVESAKIRVEGIIREDFNLEAMEILELYCELILARFGIIEQMKQCDPGIQEAVYTLIYAAPRSEIKELSSVRDQLISKYGKEFAMNAIDNKDNCVNDRVVQNLKVLTPDRFLVNRYLEEIAKSYNVDWTPDLSDEGFLGLDSLLNSTSSNNNVDTINPTTYTALPDFDLLMEDINPQLLESNNNSEQNDANDALLPDVPSLPPSIKKYNKLGKPPSPILPDSSNSHATNSDDISTPPPYSASQETHNQSSSSTKSGKSNDELPDFEELTRRFEALKKK